MIYLDESNVGRFDAEAVAIMMATGQISTNSPLVTEFEKAMARYLGVEETLAVNSGTSALHLALMDCGIGPGDEVIIPALTFVATRNVIEYMRANTLIADVNRETWLLSKYSSFFYARLPVDLYGNIFDGKNEIIDAAESLGGRKQHNGLICYSFNGNKTMTTGGGGLLVGENLDHIRQKINPGHYDGVGYNYRMTGLNAALGLAQLKRLPYFLQRKRAINKIYRNELEGLVKFQEATPQTEPSWWYTACLFSEDIDIENLQSKLKEQDIPTRRIFTPLADLPNACYIYEHGLCLPSSSLNSENDIQEVCKKIRQFI